jgi:hypothetical protein
VSLFVDVVGSTEENFTQNQDAMDRPLDGLSNQGGNPNNPRGGGRGRGRGRGRGNYYQNQRTVEGYPQQAQYEQQPPQQQVQYNNRAMDNVFGGGLSVQVPLDGRTGVGLQQNAFRFSTRV